MRRLIAALLLLPVPAVADVVAAPAADCARDYRVLETSAAKGLPGGFQRLDRLPPAAEYLTVYRRVGTCPTPVIVRYDIGQTAVPPRQ